MLQSIHCPECRGECVLEPPEDACLYFFTCTCCHRALRPQPGDCCVLCSYGEAPCPPQRQEEGTWGELD